jgi:BirA family biotin operon repressor/biotin-[acetyl-CoA-carboxylase] ligase
MIVWFDTCASTMAEAARLVREGCPSGTAIVAEEQTGGYGRHGRAWHSERGAGLYVSIVLRLAIPPESVPVLSLALGLATAEAIASSTGLACDLRWPNDVLIGKKKCAGVLVQLGDAAAIAGIGVNVNQVAFPNDIATLATSLYIATGRQQSREELLIELLGAVDRHLDLIEYRGPGAILDLFAGSSSYVRGRRVTIDMDGESVRGTADGLDPSGFLWLRCDDGSRRLILSGGVRPV